MKSTRAPDRFGEGFYVGLRYGTFSIGDDFDGETALVGPDDLIVVPAFADAGGIGYAIRAGAASRPTSSSGSASIPSRCPRAPATGSLWGRAS